MTCVGPPGLSRLSKMFKSPFVIEIRACRPQSTHFQFVGRRSQFTCLEPFPMILTQLDRPVSARSAAVWGPLQTDPYGAFVISRPWSSSLLWSRPTKKKCSCWDPHMLDARPAHLSPFRKDGKIVSASTFSTRLRNLVRRARYACPPTIHDFRAFSSVSCPSGLHLLTRPNRPLLFLLLADETSRASGRPHQCRVLRSNESWH